jgi:hypothetical protein
MRRTLTHVTLVMLLGLLFMGGVNIVQNFLQSLQKNTHPHPVKKHILAYD